MKTSQDNQTEKTKEQMQEELDTWYKYFSVLSEENNRLEKQLEDQQKTIEYFKENYTPNHEYQRAKCILSAMIASSVLIFNIPNFSLFSTILYFVGSIILFFVLICLVVDGLIEITSEEILSPITSLLSPFIIIALIYIIAFLYHIGFFDNNHIYY